MEIEKNSKLAIACLILSIIPVVLILFTTLINGIISNGSSYEGLGWLSSLLGMVFFFSIILIIFNLIFSIGSLIHLIANKKRGIKLVIISIVITISIILFLSWIFVQGINSVRIFS